MERRQELTNYKLTTKTWYKESMKQSWWFKKIEKIGEKETDRDRTQSNKK